MVVVIVVMLGTLVLSAGIAFIVASFASKLTCHRRTRSYGTGICVVGAIGVILTDLLVHSIREAPSMLDGLNNTPTIIQLLIGAFDWAFIASPDSVCAYISSSLFGFAWAAGLTTAFVVVVLSRHGRPKKGPELCPPPLPRDRGGHSEGEG